MQTGSTIALTTVLALFVTGGCGFGGRDAQDIASDLEGTVSPGMVARVGRDVDLQRAPFDLSVGRGFTAHYGSGDQPALDELLRDAAREFDGAHIRVTQQSVEDTGANGQQLTVTLAVERRSETQYIPVVMDLVREGRQMVVTRARVMTAAR